MDERGEAIEHLYRQRYVHFRDGVATITGSYETARDVVQEAFARALRKRRTFRGEGSLEAWVWKIAVRTAYEHRRETAGPSLNGTIESALVEPERDPALAEALRTLPVKRRLIVFLLLRRPLVRADSRRVRGERRDGGGNARSGSGGTRGTAPGGEDT